MDKTSLGDRMKMYENKERNYLINKTPVIIRLDGKAFHTFTKGMQKPFDDMLMTTMFETATYLCERIQGCKIAYIQSDEISLLLTDWETKKTDSWFDYNIQKIVSVSASMATLAFNKNFRDNVNRILPMCETEYGDKLVNKFDAALFDSRVFNLPKEEVVNYFIWRQQDASRNSIQAVAQANFSHKKTKGLNCSQLQELLFQERQINWNNLEIPKKRGACIIKKKYMKLCGGNGRFKSEVERSRWIVDLDIPIFTADREYINKFLI